MRQAAVGRTPARFVGPEVAAEIGERVEHSTRVAYVAYTYGLPLEYHGELAGEAWPRPARGWPLARRGEGPRSIGQRLEGLGFPPDYFVITDFREYERHHADLRAALERDATLVTRAERYAIWAVDAGVLGR